ncbi:UNVERIFIED_CONTAM: hypothetical protein Scaly_2416400 [Sesamum calycinum]|uniref:Uncharacterized protein n=1 Tax=Sesamum calycinum TaxID=2727403 RepID=A0AAW2M086_9LAMI
MYRSGSSTRVSDEFSSHPSSTATTDAEQLLPTFSPESHLAKKEKIRLRSAETAVHIIPLLLVLCAAILCGGYLEVQMASIVAATISFMLEANDWKLGGGMVVRGWWVYKRYSCDGGADCVDSHGTGSWERGREMISSTVSLDLKEM